MPTANVIPGSGNIQVLGAGPTPGLPSDYIVKFGVVFLTPELAEQAGQFGWNRVGTTKGHLIVVERGEAEWAKHDAVSHVR